MNELETKTVEILDKLDAMTTQYAPDVIEKAVTAVSVTGIHNLVNALLGFVAVYIAWFCTKKLTTFFCKQKERKRLLGGLGGWVYTFLCNWWIGKPNLCFNKCLGNN